MDRFLCFLMSSLLFNPVYLTGRFPELRDALEKLQLNDAALKVGKISSILRYYEFWHFLDPKKKKKGQYFYLLVYWIGSFICISCNSLFFRLTFF